MAETGRMTFGREIKGPTHQHHGNKGALVFATGTIALDGSGATTVDCSATHGLTTILAAGATLYSADLTGASGVCLTSVTWATDVLSIWPFEYVGGTTEAFIASNDTESVAYWVLGTV